MTPGADTGNLLLLRRNRSSRNSNHQIPLLKNLHTRRRTRKTSHVLLKGRGLPNHLLQRNRSSRNSYNRIPLLKNLQTRRRTRKTSHVLLKGRRLPNHHQKNPQTRRTRKTSHLLLKRRRLPNHLQKHLRQRKPATRISLVLFILFFKVRDL